MLAHHVVTCALVYFSYVGNNSRIGAIIFFLHDGCDVILECGKVILYAGHETTANLMLGPFVVSWLIFRIAVWFYKVYLSTLFESWDEMGEAMPNWYAFNAGLGVIW
jgi:very-long-chain ceramide synthase